MYRRHLLAFAATPAFAQDARPARMLVPYGAGNITDQVARVLADALAPRWGGRLTVENQPGASGMLGTQTLTRSPPDGSVFAMISVAALAILPHVTRQMRYDPLTDLAPIAGVSVSSSFMAVHPSLPVRTLAELAAHCRARPAGDPVFYYSPGNATVPHLNLEAIRRALDFPMEHVPYRTSAAGNTDLLAGRVQVTMDSASLTLQHMLTGALRPIVYNHDRRHPQLPDVPTIGEAAPGLTLLNAWQGLFFPRATPAAIIDRTARDVLDVIGTPDFAARLPIGTSPLVMDPAALAAHMRADHERLGRLVAAIGLTVD